MRVGVVEDNPDLASSLVSILRDDGHRVELAQDGEEADALLLAEAFDLLILDLGLPHLDGFEVLRRLRARSADTAVLVLTARSALDDRVKGLDLGADDYLTKPFEIAEFEARVRALLRRRAGAAGAALRLGTLEYHVGARTASLGGRRLDLPRRELDLLEALVLRVGRVTPKEELAEAVSTIDEPVSDTALELYASRLRKKLEPARLKVRCLRGLGYILECP